MKILITGATGFVGKKLTQLLLESTEHDLIIGLNKSALTENLKYYSRLSTVVLPCSKYSEFNLFGIDIIIHLAAYIPASEKKAENLMNELNEVNIQATTALAVNAALSGVKRFIYLSTLKVNGESTLLSSPFKSDLSVIPTSPYGISKYTAEEALKALAQNKSMEYVIIRPPLVYGPGVKGNFEQLLRLILMTKFPLPFGSLNRNKRSYVYIDNLIDLICVCIKNPKAANQVFLVSDDEDISTTELMTRMAKYFDKRLLLLPLPVWMLKSIAFVFRRKDQVRRLCDSLHVDIQKTKNTLDWQPKVRLNDGLQRMIKYYVSESNK